MMKEKRESLAGVFGYEAKMNLSERAAASFWPLIQLSPGSAPLASLRPGT